MILSQQSLKSFAFQAPIAIKPLLNAYIDSRGRHRWFVVCLTCPDLALRPTPNSRQMAGDWSAWLCWPSEARLYKRTWVEMMDHLPLDIMSFSEELQVRPNSRRVLESTWFTEPPEESPKPEGERRQDKEPPPTKLQAALEGGFRKCCGIIKLCIDKFCDPQEVEAAAARWSKASSKSSGKANTLTGLLEKDVLEKQATDLSKQISTSLLRHQDGHGTAGTGEFRDVHLFGGTKMLRREALGCAGLLLAFSLRAFVHPDVPCRGHMARLAMRAKGAEVKGELQPLYDYVLVKSKEAVTSTKSGLLLPTSSEKPSEGEVVAVGPGSVKELLLANGVQVPVWAQAGMKILHGKYGVEEVTYNDEDHVLVQDEDVLLSYTGDEPTLENIKMPRGKVLLKLLEEEKESQGGILLSKGAAKPDTTVGEVVAVGDDDLDRNGNPVPMDVAVGDLVRFRFGNEVKLDIAKSEFRSVSASECLAKWTA
eukprot:s2224_g8.t1